MNQNDTVSLDLAKLGKSPTTNNETSRRKFLGQVGAALAGGAPPGPEPTVGGVESPLFDGGNAGADCTDGGTTCGLGS